MDSATRPGPPTSLDTAATPVPSRPRAAGLGGGPDGQLDGAAPPPGRGTPGGLADGTAGGAALGGASGGRPDGVGLPGGNAGGLLEATTPSTAVVDLLTTDAETFTWAAATVGAQNAAGYQLAIGLSVMPIGGFNGSDPSPTLEQFQTLVDSGEIHYYVSGGSLTGGSQDSSEIAQWVMATFSPTTVDGVTLYDLTTR